jgi:hypothetical protein
VKGIRELVENAYAIFTRDSITGIKGALKQDVKCVSKFYKSDKVALESLNPYLLALFIDIIIDISPEIIFDGPSGQFQDLLNIIIMNALVFRDDKNLQSRMYLLLQKIIQTVNIQVETIQGSVVQDLLSIQLLSKIINDHLDFS